MRRQVPLSLVRRVDPEPFVAGEANADALSWMEKWPNWRAVIIHGPKSCGKTSLIKLLAGALFLDGDEELPQSATGFVVDDADSLTAASPERERWLLHLVNWARQLRQPLCLTAAAPPAAWGLKLAALSSRLLAMPAVAITLPNQQLLRALIAKLAADCGAETSPQVVEWLVTRMTRDYQTAARLMKRLDELSLRDKSPITMAHAKQALSEVDD